MRESVIMVFVTYMDGVTWISWMFISIKLTVSYLPQMITVLQI